MTLNVMFSDAQITDQPVELLIAEKLISTNEEVFLIIIYVFYPDNDLA